MVRWTLPATRLWRFEFFVIGVLATFGLLAAAGGANAQSPGAFFRERQLSGAIVMQDVRTRAVVVSASAGQDVNAPVLPLSTTKLFIAASFLEHELGDLDADSLIVHGIDNTGRKIALELRHRLGSKLQLADIARFGFARCGRPPCVSLSSDTPDEEWADTMSVGEQRITVTLLQLSRFLRAVGTGGDGLMSRKVAQTLQSALLDTVEKNGTAHGILGRVGKGWRIGGKTGSGPGTEHPTDGIFAGLVFDSHGAARYTVVTYVRHGGPGGGAAADISADVARSIVRR
ncbi:MAG: penicillin-binding transpeptidase domain-containing protein [Rhizomicrobium sp.]|jgi:hypothetical protein